MPLSTTAGAPRATATRCGAGRGLLAPFDRHASDVTTPSPTTKRFYGYPTTLHLATSAFVFLPRGGVQVPVDKMVLFSLEILESHFRDVGPAKTFSNLRNIITM
jgi:hypothetical protein